MSGLVEGREVRAVCVVGLRAQSVVECLRDWSEATGVALIAVEPDPSTEMRATFVAARSLSLLECTAPEGIFRVDRPVEVWVIDGDPNYWSVLRALEAVESSCGRHGVSDPVMLVQRSGWPCGRRDFYRDPGALPADAVRPSSLRLGVHPDSPYLVARGLRGEPHLAIAVDEGGPRNGVLTAVEDFIAGRSVEYELRTCPLFFGFAVLWRADDRRAADLAAAMDPWCAMSLLHLVERDRVSAHVSAIEAVTRAAIGRDAAAREPVVGSGTVDVDVRSDVLALAHEELRRLVDHSFWLRALEVLEKPIRRVRPGDGSVRHRLRMVLRELAEGRATDHPGDAGIADLPPRAP